MENKYDVMGVTPEKGKSWGKKLAEVGDRD